MTNLKFALIRLIPGVQSMVAVWGSVFVRVEFPVLTGQVVNQVIPYNVTCSLS